MKYSEFMAEGPSSLEINPAPAPDSKIGKKPNFLQRMLLAVGLASGVAGTAVTVDKINNPDSAPTPASAPDLRPNNPAMAPTPDATKQAEKAGMDSIRASVVATPAVTPTVSTENMVNRGTPPKSGQ